MLQRLIAKLGLIDRTKQKALATILIEDGNTLEARGDHGGALLCYEKAIRIDPAHSRAHLNRGNVLALMNRAEEAFEAYESAIRLQPDYAAAYFNKGNVHSQLGQQDLALYSYKKALALNPEFIDAEFAIGCTLDDHGEYSLALESYSRVLNLKPEYAQAYYNSGLALRELMQFRAAEACLKKALVLDENFAEGHNALANVLKDLCQFEESEYHYRKAISINPKYFDAWSNFLFFLNYLPKVNVTSLLDATRNYGTLVERHTYPLPNSSNRSAPDKLLRIGFVSGDLRAHPVGFFVEGVFEPLARLSHDSLELHVFHNYLKGDSTTDRIKSNVAAWHNVAHLSDDALATKIINTGIDILIDLSGHTAHNRLPVFALKPAPLQMSWLGYFASTGVKAVDYILTDLYSTPIGYEKYFSEKVYRLPETRMCFTPPAYEIDVSALPAISNGHVTFACFNNLTKVNADVIAVWAKLLTVCIDSRLLLKAPQLSDASARAELLNHFKKCQIAPDRLILEGLSARDEYLATYRKVDIALDPFPFTGGTTSAEALWMGVPVLTLAGDSLVSRQGVSILSNVGLTEWIADNTDDYVLKGLDFSRDISKLSQLRSQLRKQVLASPLFDSNRFAHHFAFAMRDMWKSWCRSQNNMPVQISN